MSGTARQRRKIALEMLQILPQDETTEELRKILFKKAVIEPLARKRHNKKFWIDVLEKLKKYV